MKNEILRKSRRIVGLLMAGGASLLAAMSPCTLQAAPEAESAFVRVMTYNIHNSAQDRNTPNDWNGRRDALAAVIEGENPDVAGFQEVLPDQRKWLEERFPGYGFTGDGRNADRKSGEASPVMYRKSRFDVVKEGTFWLSETPDVPGSKSWKAALPRICSYAVLKDKTTGKKFCFANTHTDHASEEAREKGMLLVVERMKEFGADSPIVFTGDHNCLEYEKPAQSVANILNDALYVSERMADGPWRTFNYWHYRDNEQTIGEALKLPLKERGIPGGKSDSKRIDYIYVSPGTRVIDFRTVASVRPGTTLYPSDHFPSVADLVIDAVPSAPYVIEEPGIPKLVFDTSKAPDLRKWTEETFAPAIRKWVGRLIDDMKSDGWKPFPEIRFQYVVEPLGHNAGAPAWAAGNKVSLRSEWFRRNLDGESLGATIHELVHVIQAYWSTPGCTRENCPTWASEGFADYVRWFLFEPESDGCGFVRKNPDKYHYNDSYRVTASFFDFVERHHPGAMKKLNVVLREHAFDDGKFWTETTGKTAKGLELAWRAELKGVQLEETPSWLQGGLDALKGWGDAGAPKTALDAAKARPKLDAGGEVTACFIDWINKKYGNDFLAKLKQALADGRYGEALWVGLTGKSRLRLGREWRDDLLGLDRDKTVYSTLDAKDILDWVDPFVGSGGTGHTTPAATHPFGMVQPGPDTGPTPGQFRWHYCAGYQYTDTKVARFSQLHIQGTGCADSYDVSFMPFCGTVESEKGDDFWAAFDKKDEKATPGYYGVTLDNGTKVEMTATPHAAIYRITFLQDDAKLLFDPAWGARDEEFITYSAVSKMKDNRVFGRIERKGWSPHKYWFSWEVSETPVSETVIEQYGSAKVPKTVYAFKGNGEQGTGNGKKVIYLKVSLSRNSADAAQRNIDAEIPGWDFDGTLAATRGKWRELIGRVLAKGTAERLKTLYAAIYHTMYQPNLISDFGERNVYSTLSCWDTYRAAGPLYTILAPEYVPEFVNTFIWHFDQHGFMPIWTLWDHDNQCMIGVHSIPMLVDAYLKGFKGVDWRKAFECVKASITANETMKKRWKAEYDILDKYGYYPFDVIKKNGGKEGVSRLMEGNYNDACAARLAKGLGLKDDAKFFEDRSHCWTNLYDSVTGFVRAKDSKGKFREPFDPFALQQPDPLRGNKIVYSLDYCEGNAWHYNWHQQHDAERMIELEGGKEKAAEKLQKMFTVNPYRGNSGGDGNESGLLGQYCHGNEPCHHVIYYFTLMGRRDLAAKYVREVAETLYSSDFMGLCGNEDCGQMSSWYIFSTLGFYPFDPCGGNYVLGEALLPEISIDVGGGKKFTVKSSGDGSGKGAVKLDGKVVEGAGISHADVMKGGELSFE